MDRIMVSGTIDRGSSPFGCTEKRFGFPKRFLFYKSFVPMYTFKNRQMPQLRVATCGMTLTIKEERKPGHLVSCV